MNHLTIKGISLDALSVATPDNTEVNSDLNDIFSDTPVKQISNTIGIHSRKVADDTSTASDLMYDAIVRLLKHERLKINDIGCLICVNQTPDHIIPGNSFILCNKLKASSNMFTLDINAGCSGFTHGMITIAKLMEQSNIKYGILVTGDTISKLINPLDHSTRLIFGDAAAACLFKQNKNNANIYATWKTIASGYQDIMVPAGGMKAPLTNENCITKSTHDGIQRSDKDLHMNGVEVFNFTIKEVPEMIINALNQCNLTKHDIDFFVFHQANGFIVDYIRKKLNIPKEQTIIQVDEIGNTSSASIPTALYLEAKKKNISRFNGKMCFSGFGAGLSLSSVITNVCDLKIIF